MAELAPAVRAFEVVLDELRDEAPDLDDGLLAEIAYKTCVQEWENR